MSVTVWVCVPLDAVYFEGFLPAASLSGNGGTLPIGGFASGRVCMQPAKQASFQKLESK